jgi:hypothetical protein
MPTRDQTNLTDRSTITPRHRRCAAVGGVIVSLAIVAAGACGAGGVEEAGESGARGDAGTRGAAVVGTLSETSTGGTRVRVAFDPDPLAAGPLTLTLAMDPPPADPGAVSLDLVSPEMPMHGVMRYLVQENGPGRFTAAVVIPMEGLWEFYVNLDIGLDTAPFAVHVLPAGPDGSGPLAEADMGSRDHGHEHAH